MQRSALVFAAAALAASFSFAQDTSTGKATAGQGATPMDASAADYWNKHAKGGYMSRQDTLNYRSGGPQSSGAKDAQPMDYSAIDTDQDGRTSQSEWMAWQRMHADSSGSGMKSGAGARGDGSTGSGSGSSTGSGAPSRNGTTKP